jgi:hypothetical protein
MRSLSDLECSADVDTLRRERFALPSIRFSPLQQIADSLPPSDV